MMKMYVYAVLIIAVMAFAKWAHGAVYDQGYNAATVAAFEVQEKAVAEAVKEARIQWDLSAEAATDNIIIEERIVERIKIVERDVPRIVTEFVAAECLDLGPDIQRVFNDAITASAAEAGHAGATAEPVD